MYPWPEDEVEITDLHREQNTSEHNIQPVRPRFSLRQRRIQVMITTTVVLVTLLALLINVFQGGKASLFPRATPTATLAPGVGLFYIQVNPSWGHIALDGHVLASLPKVGIDPPLSLSRGQHSIEWRVAPFENQHCSVSVPPDFAKDTCSYHYAIDISEGLSAWVMTFSASLANLPDKQRAALAYIAQVALDTQQSSTPVQTGEFYASSSSCKPEPRVSVCAAVATEPMQATLHFQLMTDPTNEPCVSYAPVCNAQAPDCHLFCSGGPTQMLSSATILEWSVLAVVRSLWDFTTQDGRLIASNQPDNSFGDSTSRQLVALQIVWDGSNWEVSPQLTDTFPAYPANPTCTSTQNEINMPGFLGDVRINRQPVDWLLASDFAQANGCVAVAIPQINSELTPTPATPYTGPAAYCFHYLGILLAANTLAHQLWPALPVADAYEQKLAKQLALSIK